MKSLLQNRLKATSKFNHILIKKTSRSQSSYQPIPAQQDCPSRCKQISVGHWFPLQIQAFAIAVYLLLCQARSDTHLSLIRPENQLCT